MDLVKFDNFGRKFIKWYLRGAAVFLVTVAPLFVGSIIIRQGRVDFTLVGVAIIILSFVTAWLGWSGARWLK